MSGDEEPISLSDAESEGEGPNIRPPQPPAGMAVKHHRDKHNRDKSRGSGSESRGSGSGWGRQGGGGVGGSGGGGGGGGRFRDFDSRPDRQERRDKHHRNRSKGKNENRDSRKRRKHERRNERERERERERGERDWGQRDRAQDRNQDIGDLRHRLGGRDRYDRDDRGRDDRDDGRGRDDRRQYDRGSRDGRERDDELGGKDRQEVEARLNKWFRANQHMEETRKDVEVRKKRKLIEKEIERLKTAADRKRRKERSHSREKKKKKKRKKSESGEESEEEMEEEESEDAAISVSGEESVEGEESEEEEGSESEGAASDATTGSQKTGSTPQSPSYEESEEEGEIDDDEEGESKDEKKGEKSKKSLSRSPSLSPVEGKWGDKPKKDDPDRTPERSPTPLRDLEEKFRRDLDEGDRTPNSDRDSPRSQSGSPPPGDKGREPMDSSPVLPPNPTDSLPPYLPSVHGCRSVAEFKCLNRIEEGTYGVVYRARDKRTQEIVALKRLKMEREKEGFPITSLREINTLLISQHPNVVTVREIVVGSNMDQIYIVMDFVHHDLKGLVETMRKKSQVFLPGEIKCLMVQLLRAIHHLHDNWILHRDIKASNLLLSHNGMLKVGDFGLAREYGSPLKPYTSIVVTLWYRAPELLLGIKEYSTHIDVWSVGCILGELLLMEPLFPGKSEVDQLNRIFKLLGTPSEKIWTGYNELPAVKKMKFVDYPISHLRNKFPEKMLSEAGLGLLKKLLTYDPKRRITCETALQDEYLKEAPGPIDPSMFPTWPAKSEQEPGDRKKQVSPPPPSGGGAYKQINQEDEDEMRARGFSLIENIKNKPVTAGWNLKF